MKLLINIMLSSCLLIAATPTFAAAKKKTVKVTYAQAKRECLKDDPSLEGKTLQSCIKQKRK